MPRVMIAHPSGEIVVGSLEDAVANMGVSPAMSAAVDILMDAGQTDEKTLSLVMAAERSGKDPEAFARHLLKLRRALKDIRKGTDG